MTPRQIYRTPCERVRVSRPRGERLSATGFTLIELLTVIAIIAILAGIIFPVFGTVRENARRGACMSNMRQIYQGVRQYKLDNRSYPEYLYTPAVDAQGNLLRTGQAFLSMSEAGTKSRVLSKTLYPEYIRSVDVFHCPNNSLGSSPNDKTPAAVTPLVKKLEMEAGPQPFVTYKELFYYKYDSYDANPRIDVATRKLYQPVTFVARYSRNWTPFFAAAAGGPGEGRKRYGADYDNQLTWTQPSDETYITMCSYHVSGEKAIVLWLNGTTKVLDLRKFDQFKNTSAEPWFDYDFYKFAPTD